MWASPGQLRGQVEENLRQLGLDHLDVVNLRLRVGAPAAERELLRTCGAGGVAYVPFFAIAGQGRATGAIQPEREDVLAMGPVTGAPPVPSAATLPWSCRLTGWNWATGSIRGSMMHQDHPAAPIHPAIAQPGAPRASQAPRFPDVTADVLAVLAASSPRGL